MSEVQKQGNFTCPNCGTEAWIWSKKDPDFKMPEEERLIKSCSMCFGMNRTHPEDGSVGLSQIVIGKDGKYSVYDICPNCSGKGWVDMTDAPSVP